MTRVSSLASAPRSSLSPVARAAISSARFVMLFEPGHADDGVEGAARGDGELRGQLRHRSNLRGRREASERAPPGVAAPPGAGSVDTLGQLRHNLPVCAHFRSPSKGLRARWRRAAARQRVRGCAAAARRNVEAKQGARTPVWERNRGKGSRQRFPGDPGTRRSSNDAPGIEVVNSPGLSPGELLQAIADADALVIRSGTKVTEEVIDAAKTAEGDRPRRHRRRQRRCRRRHEARHRGDEHARRQHHHHRRARHRAAHLAGAPHPPGHRLDEGRQVGEEELHREGALQPHPRRARAGQHRPHRGGPRARARHEGHRPRPVHLGSGREQARPRAGLLRRAARALGHHHRARPEEQGHHRPARRRSLRQGQARRAAGQRGARRHRRRGGAARGARSRPGGRRGPRRLRRGAAAGGPPA